jgi:hypothetical protein
MVSCLIGRGSRMTCGDPEFGGTKTKTSRNTGGFCFVGVAGFEPATPWSQTRCANRTALYPEEGVGVGVGVECER